MIDEHKDIVKQGDENEIGKLSYIADPFEGEKKKGVKKYFDGN